jgi:hypothetical protein
MATPTEEARQKVIEARTALGGELGELVAAGRSAVDIPAKVRAHPLQTVAAAGGAGFLLVGGPRRVLRAVTSRVIPHRRRPHEGLLPEEMEAVLKRRAGAHAPEVAAALAEDFAGYLQRKGERKPPPSAASSLWKTYDSVIGPIARVAGLALVVAALRGRSRPRAGAGDTAGPDGGGAHAATATSAAAPRAQAPAGTKQMRQRRGPGTGR